MAKTLRQIRKAMRGYKSKLLILQKEEDDLLLPQQYIFDKWLAGTSSEYNSIHEAYTKYINIGGLWDFGLFSKLFIQHYQRRSYRDGAIVKKRYIKHSPRKSLTL